MTGTRSEIVLIGPVRTGKSTLGKLLAQRLGVPQVSLDDARWRYYREIGYDDALAQEIRSRGGFLALVLYWNLFDAYAAERLLAEHRSCVFDFGAGIYWNDEVLERVQGALHSFHNVVLLLPAPDPNESIRILRARRYRPTGGPQLRLHRVLRPASLVLRAGKAHRVHCGKDARGNPRRNTGARSGMSVVGRRRGLQPGAGSAARPQSAIPHRSAT